jgi:hypothetical protein
VFSVLCPEIHLEVRSELAESADAVSVRELDAWLRLRATTRVGSDRSWFREWISGREGSTGFPEWLASVLDGVGHQSLAEVGFASFWMTCSESLEGICSFNFGAMLRLAGIGEMEMCMPLDT